jgi:hypothetical protein
LPAKKPIRFEASQHLFSVEILHNKILPIKLYAVKGIPFFRKMFGFRNRMNFLVARRRIDERLSATEGESGSEGLPALRRYRICISAFGHRR